MPKIPPTFLDGVFYLYASREDAIRGSKFGGTGFLVGIPSRELPGGNYVYAVSNWHVVNQGGFSVVRLNRDDGQSEIVELSPEDWEFDGLTGHDIAVAPIKLNARNSLRFSMAHIDALVTKDKFTTTEESAIGVGDDVFMVGRFVDHDGGATNKPAVRFGHISIGPSILETALGTLSETICIDTNSRTGFSGSPVYFYRTMVSDLEELSRPKWHNQIPLLKHPTLMLLGIHTGQFPEWWDWRDGEDQFSIPGRVRGVSGMTRVAPAWFIRQLLDAPKLRNVREAVERLVADGRQSGASPAQSENEAAVAFSPTDRTTTVGPGAG